MAALLRPFCRGAATCAPPRTLPRTLAQRASTALLVMVFALSSLVSASPAHALTGDDIVARARTWVDAKVPYSQTRYHNGYRTDCSGFVSMAWGLDSSYTTRSIGTHAVSVPLSELKRGDAILTPGHIVIFAGWADESHTTFLSLEEANRRLGSVARVKKLPSNGRGLRFGGLTQPAPPVPQPAEKRPSAKATQASFERTDLAAAELCLERAADLVASVDATRPSYATEHTAGAPGDIG